MTKRLSSIARPNRAPLMAPVRCPSLLALALTLVSLGAGCGGAGGKYVRVEDLPRTMHTPGDYRIRTG